MDITHLYRQLWSGQNVNSADTAAVSEAYAKILTIFIPLLVDEVKVLDILSPGTC